MARTPRTAIDGGIYHVMNRGNRKATIFEDARDRRRFLTLLIHEKDRYGVRFLAGTEMGNHFHLVVGTPNGNLSEFMEQLQGRFARYCNWRYERVGHLFQGRFRDVVIEGDIHLLIALCYVFLNPVSAGLVTRPEDWRWSTYAATVGLAPVPDYLSIEWLMALFDCDSIQEAQRRFHKLLSEAKPVAAYLRQGMTGVDPESVRRVLRSYTGGQLLLGRLPRIYRSALRSPLPDLVHADVPSHSRAAAIYEAHVVHGYTLAEIARHLGLHKSTVSKCFRSSLRHGLRTSTESPSAPSVPGTTDD